jgi:CIC family chloride channel protein
MQARHGAPARAFGVLGGGYGVAQAALSGASWLPTGGELVLLLCVVAAAKMAASALTIGSGGAAGDFAPSLVIGALVGSAFGQAAVAVTGDATLRPAAFALVGMGTFYGGVAHAPLSALVLVSELAGSYDLLVPMMLTVGIAYVALRRWSLYPAQPASRAESPVHRPETATPIALPALAAVTVRADDVLTPPELPDVEEATPLRVLAAAASGAARQRVVLVRSAEGRPRGLVEIAIVAELARDDLANLRAHDAMVPFTSLDAAAGWAQALAELQRRGLSQLPVLEGGVVRGWIGDRELLAAVLRSVPPAAPAGAAR